MSAPSPSGPIRIVIVDDHQVLVDALRLIVDVQNDMTLVAAGNSCDECLALVQQYSPGVLLLDVRLPDGDGIDLVPAIKAASPETNILILTSLSDEANLMRAMQAGVSGFTSKSRNLSEVLQAIRKAAAGEIAIAPGLLLALLDRTTPMRKSTARLHQDTLTLREREILSLLASGKSIEQIAASLTIAPLTARTHVRNLMQKLGVHSRLQAVIYALQNGLIDRPE